MLSLTGSCAWTTAVSTPEATTIGHRTSLRTRYFMGIKFTVFIDVHVFVTLSSRVQTWLLSCRSSDLLQLARPSHPPVASGAVAKG